MSGLPALAVMARAPGSERVKSRLHAALGVAPATLLYRCFLLDGLDAAAALPGVAPVLAYSPPRAVRAMAALAPPGMRLVAQRGGDLGARMAQLVARLLADGHRAALLIGSDLPTLPSAHLSEAARVLVEGAADVVLGPAEDGGYYLIGLARPAPALFEDIAWSTDAVLEATRARARRLGLREHLLPAWYDVDTAADLDRLRRDLAPAGPGARRTRRWLAAFAPGPL
jgi:uncharacterized protein